MISSHDDWLTESDLDILLLPVVRGDDGSEGILDDARLGVGGPSVDSGQGSVLSREPSRPLHHHPPSIFFPQYSFLPIFFPIHLFLASYSCFSYK